MNARIAFPLLALALLMGSGCHFKSPDSFVSATKPEEHQDVYPNGGDKYSNGGIANATGGLKPDAQYGTGAKTGAGTVMNIDGDAPAKGSGLRPGENPGTGHPNGPAHQGNASEFQASTGGNRG